MSKYESFPVLGVPLLVKAFQDHDYRVRLHAFEVASREKAADDAVIRALMQAVRSGDPCDERGEYQTRAIESLVKLAPDRPETLDAILHVMKDQSERVSRSTISYYLGKLTVDTHRAVPVLLSLARNPQAKEAARIAALEHAAEIAPASGDVYAALVAIRAEGNRREAFAAADALAATSDTEAVLRIADDDLNSGVVDRFVVGARTAGRLGEPARAVAPVLMRGLDHENGDVRQVCLDALARIGPLDDNLPHIVKCLRDPIPEVRLVALSCLTPDLKLPHVDGAFREPYVDMRFFRITMLPKTEGFLLQEKGLVAPVTELLGDPDERVQCAALFLLGEYVVLEARPQLLKKFANSSGYVQLAAARAIMKLGPVGYDEVPAVLELMKVGDPTVDRNCDPRLPVDEIGAYSGSTQITEAAIPKLHEILQGNPDERTRRAAVALLGHFEASAGEIASRLCESITTASRPMQKSILQSLQKLGIKPESIPVLEELRSTALAEDSTEGDVIVWHVDCVLEAARAEQARPN